MSTGISQHLEEVFAQANAVPNTYSQDLEAVVAYSEALLELFDTVRKDVYVASAVIQLENSSGYRVGHIIFDAEADAFRFIPHIDEEAKA